MRVCLGGEIGFPQHNLPNVWKSSVGWCCKFLCKYIIFYFLWCVLYPSSAYMCVSVVLIGEVCWCWGVFAYFEDCKIASLCFW